MATETKYIFIHIPKTAGISVNRAIELNKIPLINHGHARASVIIDRIGLDTWNNCRCFTVIRNIFDRFVSTFYFLLNMTPNVLGGLSWYNHSQPWREYVSQHCNNNISLYIQLLLDNKEEMLKLGTSSVSWNFLPQWFWLDVPLSAKPIDLFFAFDTLNEDFLKTFQIQLPKINITNHKNYEEVLTVEDKNRLLTIYKIDITNQIKIFNRLL
jgi:hypothetical protein